MQLSPIMIAIALLSVLSLILAIIALFRLGRMIRHYNSLTNGVEPKNLLKALEGIQKTLAEHERTSTITKKEIKEIEQKLKSYIQTISLKRFNPFGDTGGDQSFIMGLLDGNGDGVVITSLHSRENTRFYVKSVKGGVGVGHPLSSDEQKIIRR